ncbi:MAG: hypothetical protein IIA87_05345 [Nanoarchaeota archaeon]|nr:hypothetical protein [Nanoarchaeota archaeon]
MIVILTNRKRWWPITKSVYGNPAISGVIFFILAAVVLFYLLQELTIVQIIATAAFVSLLMGLGFM